MAASVILFIFRSKCERSELLNFLNEPDALKLPPALFEEAGGF